MQTHAILCRLVAFVFVSTSADAIDQQLCRCKCIHAERWMNWISRYIQLLVCHFVWLRDIFNISCDWIVQGRGSFITTHTISYEYSPRYWFSLCLYVIKTWSMQSAMRYAYLSMHLLWKSECRRIAIPMKLCFCFFGRADSRRFIFLRIRNDSTSHESGLIEKCN